MANEFLTVHLISPYSKLPHSVSIHSLVVQRLLVGGLLLLLLLLRRLLRIMLYLGCNLRLNLLMPHLHKLLLFLYFLSQIFHLIVRVKGILHYQFFPYAIEVLV